MHDGRLTTKSTVKVRVTSAVDDWKIVTAFTGLSDAFRILLFDDIMVEKQSALSVWHETGAFYTT